MLCRGRTTPTPSTQMSSARPAPTGPIAEDANGNRELADITSIIPDTVCPDGRHGEWLPQQRFMQRRKTGRDSGVGRDRRPWGSRGRGRQRRLCVSRSSSAGFETALPWRLGGGVSLSDSGGGGNDRWDRWSFFFWVWGFFGWLRGWVGWEEGEKKTPKKNRTKIRSKN